MNSMWHDVLERARESQRHASSQIKAGDVISVRLRNGEPTFTRDGSEPKKSAAEAKVLR